MEQRFWIMKGSGNKANWLTKADYETRGIAYFRTINDNLKLVAEYNQFELDAAQGSGLNENTNTFAVGAVVNW